MADSDFTSEQTLDLFSSGWSLIRRSGYYLEENLVCYPGKFKSDSDSKGPFIVRSPKSRLVSIQPIQALNDPPSKDKPVLFRKFIDLNGTVENFVKFANEYGQLDAELLLKTPSGEKLWGESASRWKREHWLLKTMFNLWIWTKTNAHKKLSQVITWEDQYHVSYHIGNEEEVKGFLSEDFTDLERFYFDTIGAEILSFRINGNSSKSFIISDDDVQSYVFNDPTLSGDFKLPATQILLRFINRYLSGSVSPTVRFDKKANTFKYVLVPKNLLSAMWFQFSQVISGERIIKQCPICLQWSDVTKTKGSWEKHRSCASTDRSSKSRKFPEVKTMLNNGKTIAEIAEAVNVEIHNIQRWLLQEKEGENNAE